MFPFNAHATSYLLGKKALTIEFYSNPQGRRGVYIPEGKQIAQTMTPNECREATTRGRFKPKEGMVLYDGEAGKSLGLGQKGMHGSAPGGRFGPTWNGVLNRVGHLLNSGNKVTVPGRGVPAPRAPVLGF